MLMTSSTFCVCRTPTLMVSTRLPSPLELSRVLVDDLPPLPLRSLKLMLTSALVNWLNQILTRLTKSSPIPWVSINSLIIARSDHGVPKWFLNRQRCIKDGTYSQLISNMIDTRLREDLERMKKARQHRGLRHYLGIKVRGQKTKSTGRTGKTLGVAKKKWALHCIHACTFVVSRNVQDRFSLTVVHQQLCL